MPGHPGNEWADVLADLGADCVFDSCSDEADIAYPYEQDEYEETDAAVTRGQTIPSLDYMYLTSTQLRPDGGVFKHPLDCVVWGEAGRWANVRLEAAKRASKAARNIDFNAA